MAAAGLVLEAAEMAARAEVAAGVAVWLVGAAVTSMAAEAHGVQVVVGRGEVALSPLGGQP